MLKQVAGVESAEFIDSAHVNHRNAPAANSASSHIATEQHVTMSQIIVGM
jgi:hypothetical protein